MGNATLRQWLSLQDTSPRPNCQESGLKRRMQAGKAPFASPRPPLRQLVSLHYLLLKAAIAVWGVSRPGGSESVTVHTCPGSSDTLFLTGRVHFFDAAFASGVPCYSPPWRNVQGFPFASIASIASSRVSCLVVEPHFWRTLSYGMASHLCPGASIDTFPNKFPLR